MALALPDKGEITRLLNVRDCSLPSDIVQNSSPAQGKLHVFPLTLCRITASRKEDYTSPL